MLIKISKINLIIIIMYYIIASEIYLIRLYNYNVIYF